MLTMDIFNGDAFRVAELTDAVNRIPNMWGRIGALGLFAPRPIRVPQFMIESRNGVLSLVQSSTRGTDLPGADRAKRDLRSFQTRRFGQSARITADDINGIRAFGSVSETRQVMDEVADRQIELRQNIDITREYLRAGALRGEVRDADGTMIADLFDAFGVSQLEVDFNFGTASGVPAKIDQVRRHIRTSLRGDVLSSIHALCSPEFWDKLMANDEFKEAHRYYSSVAEPLRNDVSAGIPWKGITWEEYLGEGEVPQEDGSVVTESFIPAGDARFFPLGTRQTFRQYNSPADYLETVGTPGQDFYARILPDPKANRYVDVEVQMNTLPICMRPAVLVRGHSTT